MAEEPVPRARHGPSGSLWRNTPTSHRVSFWWKEELTRSGQPWEACRPRMASLLCFAGCDLRSLVSVQGHAP
jgi:hypothetical protein